MELAYKVKFSKATLCSDRHAQLDTENISSLKNEIC